MWLNKHGNIIVPHRYRDSHVGYFVGASAVYTAVYVCYDIVPEIEALID